MTLAAVRSVSFVLRPGAGGVSPAEGSTASVTTWAVSFSICVSICSMSFMSASPFPACTPGPRRLSSTGAPPGRSRSSPAGGGCGPPPCSRCRRERPSTPSGRSPGGKNTWPGCSISSFRMSYSVGVRDTASPSTVTAFSRSSSWMPPRVSTSGRTVPPPSWKYRRSWLRTRAATSTGLKGLVT